MATLGCRSGEGETGAPTERSSEQPNGTAARPVIDDGVDRFYVPLSGDEPANGPADALVTTVELSDFESPYCAKAAPILRQLKTRYGDDIRIVWMNNPLLFHANAKPAATAALEAHAQKGDEGFWTMHDRLFANQRALDAESLQAAAVELALDIDAFKQAMSDDKYADIIARQQAIAMTLNAKGTPNFFINGRNLRGAQPLTRFALMIDEELRHAKGLVEAGLPQSTRTWPSSPRPARGSARPPSSSMESWRSREPTHSRPSRQRSTLSSNSRGPLPVLRRRPKPQIVAPNAAFLSHCGCLRLGRL